MVYNDVVEALVHEVGSQVREYGFHASFNNAPSFSMLSEKEIAKARREVAARLGMGKKRNSRPIVSRYRLVHAD